MKLLLFYLYQKKKLLISYIIFFCVFSVTFYLYHLPLMAVIYPFFICFFLSFLFLLIDFFLYKRKYILLQSIQMVSVNFKDNFPRISTMEDQQYQTIISLLCEEQHCIETRMHHKYEDMIQYYTVWVHQIKTPIASMRLSLQNEDSPFSRKLSRDVFRIEQYVEMVLMYLRLNSESTDYIIKAYPVDPIIRQVVKKFSSEFIEKKINFIYNSIDRKVITDEKWFSFVIEQLLSNALKYTSTGFIKVSMTEGQILCIEDSGMGIAPEDLPRIFENGYTGYTGRIDKKASGIGLYICKIICNKLNHKIYATSELGKGSTLRIDLSQFELDTK